MEIVMVNLLLLYSVKIKCLMLTTKRTIRLSIIWFKSRRWNNHMMINLYHWDKNQKDLKKLKIEYKVWFITIQTRLSRHLILTVYQERDLKNNPYLQTRNSLSNNYFSINNNGYLKVNKMLLQIHHTNLNHNQGNKKAPQDPKWWRKIFRLHKAILR